MSAAHAVRSIRNDVPTARTALREQMRGNESLSEEYQAAEGSLESLVKPLSARQQTAINLLSMGKSAIATAKTIGVSESTLHRWKATHPLFKAELGRRQHDLFDGMVTRLRMSMSNAIDELNSILTGDHSDLRRDAMWQMLKLLKPQKYLVPDEPSTMQAVLDEQIRDERAQRGEIPEAPIDDDQRAAAIPAEFRVNEDVKHQGHEGHEEDRETVRCINRETRENHVEETSRQLPVGNGHAERTREASGPCERGQTVKREVQKARQEPTPLPSRECDRRSLNRGPGEGAAVGKVEAVDKGKADGDGVNPRCVRNTNTDHAQPKPETVIASRPLPQPLPQGEGSQSAPSASDRQRANLGDVNAPQGQILRCAQDDGSAQHGHVERSETSGPRERQDAKSDGASSRPQKTTPLPSREGLGEGAAADEVGAKNTRAADPDAPNSRHSKDAQPGPVELPDKPTDSPTS